MGGGRPTRRLKSFLGTSPRRFGGPSSACHIWLATQPRRAIHGFPAPHDPSLTLTRTQHAAIPGNRRNERSLIYAGFAHLCNPQQPSATTGRTLVMSRKAVRVRSSALFLTCKTREELEGLIRPTGGLAAVGQQWALPQCRVRAVGTLRSR